VNFGLLAVIDGPTLFYLGADMRDTDHFSVTVSRINEAANQEPFQTWTGHSLSVERDGSLSIKWENGGQLLSAGLWDGFEVKVIRRKMAA